MPHDFSEEISVMGHHHASHRAISKRLKRANGHLTHVIDMIESQEPCVAIAQQLHAVERAIANAKTALVQDHIDHCLEESLLGDDGDKHAALADFKEIAKYL